MTKCSALISAILLFLPSVNVKGQPVVMTKEYSVVADARGRQITGIFLVGKSDEGIVAGTMVNEFGMKVFDFTYNGKKVRLLNVFPPIDKWHIRKVLRKDMAFLLAHIDAGDSCVDGRRSVRFSKDGTIILRNKYRIAYTFNPLENRQ